LAGKSWELQIVNPITRVGWEVEQLEGDVKLAEGRKSQQERLNISTKHKHKENLKVKPAV